MRWAEAEAIVIRLEAQAAFHRGLLPSEEISAAGLDEVVLRRLVRSGRWRRVCRGIYAVAAIDGGPFQPAHICLLVAGQRAFLQRRAGAAVLGGMDLDWDGVVDVAVPADGNPRFCRRSVPGAHVIVVDGLRVTDGLQTLLDLACLLEDLQWEWALEAALRRRPVGRGRRLPPLTTLELIRGALAAPARKDRAGVARVERVLALRPASAPPTDSKLETLFIQLARRFELPTPSRQVLVRTEGGHRYYVDVCWPELGVFLELDGEGHDDQPAYDASREADIIAATGWIGVRLRWRNVVNNPTPTARKVARILERGAEGRPPIAGSHSS